MLYCDDKNMQYGFHKASFSEHSNVKFVLGMIMNTLTKLRAFAVDLQSILAHYDSEVPHDKLKPV